MSIHGSLIYIEKMLAKERKRGIAEGLRMAAEMVEKLCGVNPYDNRPCIKNVDKKFWGPVCKLTGEIVAKAKEIDERGE